MNYDQIRVNTQSSIRIAGSQIVYFDPFKISDEPHDADIICITHAHYDHFDPDSIEKIRKEGTMFVAPETMGDEIGKLTDPDHLRRLSHGEEVRLGDIILKGLPAYNKLKPFHPKHNRWLGYLLEMDGIRYYIAGDTDALKELQKVQCDVALLPIGGTYTMTAKEAAGLINQMKPAAAIPTHYGSIVGKPGDAEEFRRLVSTEIQVITKL